MIFDSVNFSLLYDTLLADMEDYTIDSRGDIGSWIREASMNCFLQTLKCAAMYCTEYLEDRQRNSRLMSALLKQAVEKIDRVRVTAGSVLIPILYPQDFGWSNNFQSDGMDLILAKVTKEVNFANAADLYPNLIPLLSIQNYRQSLFEGLVVSIGGITQSLSSCASSSLIELINEMEEEEVDSFLTDFLVAFKRNVKSERLSTPFLETLDILIGSFVLNKLERNVAENIESIKGLVKSSMFKTKDTKRLSTGIKVLSSLASLQINLDLKVGSDLLFVAKYLIHPYPYV